MKFSPKVKNVNFVQKVFIFDLRYQFQPRNGFTIRGVYMVTNWCYGFNYIGMVSILMELSLSFQQNKFWNKVNFNQWGTHRTCYYRQVTWLTTFCGAHPPLNCWYHQSHRIQVAVNLPPTLPVFLKLGGGSLVPILHLIEGYTFINPILET